MTTRLHLVRWILVVSLGCSLGLLIVYVATWLRPLPEPIDTPNILISHPLRHKIAAFRLSEQDMEQELTNVITAQLADFRKDDYPDAYKYAAAGIKAQLPLPSFEKMVRQGFPFIAQSTSAQFGVIVDNGDQAVVNVTIIGATGQSRHYQYIMLREGGTWRIGGVAETRQPTGTII